MIKMQLLPAWYQLKLKYFFVVFCPGQQHAYLRPVIAVGMADKNNAASILPVGFMVWKNSLIIPKILAS